MTEQLFDHPEEDVAPVRPRRTERSLWVLFALVGLLGMVAVIAFLRGTHAQRDAAAARDDSVKNAQGLAVNNQAAKRLAKQLEQHGIIPVVQPSALPTPRPGDAGPQGLPGLPGPAPTAAEVSAAVSLYCLDHAGCAGSPTAAQVATAVRGFCASGLCRGAAGVNATGSPGVNGTNGSSPTDAQIAAAVVTYCAANGGCAGPVGAGGPAGSNGSNGAPGRGIESIDCTAIALGQTLTIHYDDGTTQTVDCTMPTPTGSPS